MLNDSAETIATEGNQDVAFDTAGHKSSLEAKNQTLEQEESKEDNLEQQRQQQTKVTNQALDDAYTTASNAAEAIVAHMGEKHGLSEIIRRERGSYHQSPGGGDGGDPPVDPEP